MNQNVVDMAVNWIVYNTRYTPFQCYRVIEIISKKGEKAPYYLTKKQKKILDLLMWLFMADNETNSEPIQNQFKTNSKPKLSYIWLTETQT